MRKILVMGATSGVGLRLAALYASRGWMVGAAGRDTARLDELSRQFPRNVVARRIDVTSPDAPEEMTRLVGDMDGMDVYLHVAGIGYGNQALSPEKEIAVMETNAVGFTRMVGAAFRWFRDSNGGKGQIAAITSVAGTNGIGMLASYSASKSCQQVYLRGLCQLCRSERLGISLTDIRPGWIRTPLLDDSQAYPMIMTAAYAAERIARAVDRKRRVAVIDWRWNLLVGLWRMVPNWLWTRLPVKVAPIASRCVPGVKTDA